MHQPGPLTNKRHVVGLACLLAFSSAVAQSPQTAPVLLASDTCPVVHPGNSIAFDWNPGFDPAVAVVAPKTINLIFHGLAEDGVTVNPRFKLLLGQSPADSISPLGNGFYHVEVSLPRSAPSGVYRLVDAQTHMQVQSDYQGPSPVITVSPARERYCITVVGSPAPQPSQSTE